MFVKTPAAAITVLCALFASLVSAAEPAPDLTLRGTITAPEHQTYRLVPFEIPPGVRAIEVRFEYTGREQRTTIDLGLLGPEDSFERAFRGWSGGNKRSFTVATSDATPSYLAGPVTAGTWNLLLGVPNIRAGQSSRFTAAIYFTRDDQPSAALEPAPLQPAAGWYRGDLHTHTGHSDGSCASRSGRQRVPCPLFVSLNQAAERGLNFVAVTEHNTNSHVRELTAMQPYFDDLLLIPGMELTTFHGHANAFDVTEPIDFRVGSLQVPDWNALLATLASKGALVSVNHPRLPSGEACMGCGWLPRPPADMSRVQAVEVVNGVYVETATSGIPFWHDLLQKGLRPTAIGGSDTHDPTSKDIMPPPARIGVPTTVVYAKSQGVAAILAGIRAGHVFVDTAGTRERALEFSARTAAAETVAMGDEIALPVGQQIAFTVRVQNVPDSRIEIIRDGTVLEALSGATITGNDHRMSFSQPGDGARHWIRVDVRNRDNRLVLIGNPIYLNWPKAQATAVR